jgi:hypothetical protein
MNDDSPEDEGDNGATTTAAARSITLTNSRRTSDDSYRRAILGHASQTEKGRMKIRGSGRQDESLR